MRIILVLALLIVPVCAVAQKAPSITPGQHAYRPSHTRDVAIASIVNTYGLHMGPEATSAQLDANAVTLGKLLTWINDQTSLNTVQRRDMLDAVARLQERNTELIAKLSVPAVPQEQTTVPLPSTLP
jgi:hypothetical protein